MRFLSLFSGIEAASMAWLPLGWECAGVAEIEKFPCAVLAHHYPDVPNLGDITKITKEQIERLGHIDLVVGGFPCQDLSIAGKRRGLKNEDGSNTRSGLFFDAMRIVRWTNARYVLLENVPGIYSSNGGRDFASMVGEILGIKFGVPADGWRNTGVAASERGLFEWATLDAQWFGVPQRRRRMFALADFGNWRSRPPVLFERHSLSGNPAPSRKAGKVAPTIPSRSSAGGGLRTDFDCDGGLIVGALTARGGRNMGQANDDVDGHKLICVATGQAGAEMATDMAPTLNCNHEAPYIARPLRAKENTSHRADMDTYLPVAHSLRDEGFDASEDGSGRGTPLVPVDVAGTMKACKDSGGWSNSADHAAGKSSKEVLRSGVQRETSLEGVLRETCTAGEKGDDWERSEKQEGSGFSQMAVRRLTPVECEFLQGFPRNYTLIDVRGKPAADGPRYKALGNSMAVPVMHWIGKRIQMVEQIAQ
ncbi:DNA (cytosine-5-)-methyltransferase [Nitrosovibrio sp. Nv6]|uniref:DNA (cytosine-5-)-methyltransferase n=1 Tax=Nitrosovibrio sp. Nv6 TaxID=1855340 RepID=UPI0008BC15C8|nr:DNA (cytosine-5-)-methyltransferase [Nitrosovibrio sp. Nv6]SEO78449.1 DNA (cytosine-5)-methyltransferase 1 [Nitrosovibrio sp. Nv6]